jgi:hypothetical protein
MKTGRLEHIQVKPDTGKGSKGASVTWRKKEGEGKNAGAWLRTETEEQKSHTSPEQAGAHVTQLLHEHFGSKGGEHTENDGGMSLREPLPKAGKTKANVSHPASDDGPNPSNDDH